METCNDIYLVSSNLIGIWPNWGLLQSCSHTLPCFRTEKIKQFIYNGLQWRYDIILLTKCIEQVQSEMCYSVKSVYKIIPWSQSEKIL